MRAGVWDDKHNPVVTQDAGLGFNEVPMDDQFLDQQLEFLPDDFFADPSLLFSGPSSTGFTGIGDQWTTREATTYLFSTL